MIQAKFFTVAFALFLAPSVAFAGGSKAPADPQIFLGTYSELVDGETLKLRDDLRLPCPDSISVETFEENGVIVKDSNGASLPFTFTKINEGVLWSANNFQESYTSSQRLVYREGYEFWGRNPGNGFPDYPGEDIPTPPDRAETYRYELELADGVLQLRTSRWGSFCRYLDSN